jgi:DNA-binding CsgD family transcriptional regulator
VDKATRDRRVEALVRRCHAGLSAAELGPEVLRRLRGVMTVDAGFFASVDPTTLLFTGVTTEEPLAAATDLFLGNEFGQPDVNKFTTLAAATHPIQSLDVATHQDRSQSTRYRDVMAPLGLGDELRAAFRVDAATWGVMCLHREDGPVGFDATDMEILRRIGPHIAEGLRRAVLLEASGDAGEGLSEPGVLMLQPDLGIAAVTPAAGRWLSEVGDAWPQAGGVPFPVYVVAQRLLAFDETVLPRVRVRDPLGRWVTLHASQLSDGSGIAVVIEPARRADAVPTILAAHGLTSREAEVSQLVLRGYSTRQIVDALHISAHTVQDHLKAVFAKTGVSSRRELVTRLLGGPH